MRNFLIYGMAFVVSLAMLLTACKKDDSKPDNSGNNNNQETPGGSEVTPNQEYPETSVVLPQAVTDIDGNTYDAVQIGDQVWMAENLRTTRYSDGTTIPLDSTYSGIEPFRYAPGPSSGNNEENMANVARYGYLYNWCAVMHGAVSSDINPSGVQGICPNGWHVPSDAEWMELTNYMKTQPTYMAGGNPDNLAKALAATWGWNSSSVTDAPGNNPSTNNATGFSALPAGVYFGQILEGRYGLFNFSALFWSATATNQYAINHNRSDVDIWLDYRDDGASVRCVRD